MKPNHRTLGHFRGQLAKPPRYFASSLVQSVSTDCPFLLALLFLMSASTKSSSEAKVRATAASEACSDEVDDSEEEESEEFEDRQEKVKNRKSRTCQFIYKLHDLVTSASEHPTDRALVRFSEDGSYFTIFERELAEKELIPRVRSSVYLSMLLFHMYMCLLTLLARTYFT